MDFDLDFAGLRAKHSIAGIAFDAPRPAAPRVLAGWIVYRNDCEMKPRLHIKYMILRIISIFALALSAAAFAAKEDSMPQSSIPEWPVKLEAGNANTVAEG